MLDSIKNEKLAIGVKQSAKAIALGEVKYLVVAKDVEPGILDGIMKECSSKNIEVRDVETMAMLGKSVGIDVGSSVVAVLNKK